MSWSENKNAPGDDSGGTREGEELGMGSFGNDIVAAKSSKQPSFKPEQLNAFKAAGHELIPLNAWNALDKNGRPLGKAPTKGWRESAPLELEQAKQTMLEGRNVGVRLRPCDLVIDVDPRNFPEGTHPLKQLEAELNITLSNFPTVVTGSGGLHIYMRKPNDLATREGLPGYPGIEFKSVGRQVVAPGSIHPGTRLAYLWDDLGPDIGRGAPDAPSCLIELIRKPESSSAVEAGEYNGEQLAEMLKGLDAENYRDHEKWFNMMAACHHATAGAGLEEFVAWSTSDASYADQADVIAARWNSLNTDRKCVTVKTLYKHLHDAGVGNLIPRISAADDFADDPDTERGNISEEDGHGQRWSNSWVWVTRAEQFISRSDCQRLSTFQFKAHNQHLWKGDILGAVWTGKLPIRKFEGCVYVPGAREVIEVGKWSGHYNTWRKGGVEPKRNDALADVFLDHMAYLLPDEKERSHALDYLSFLVRDDFVKVHFALLMQGKPGTGKSFVGAVAEQMVGIRNTRMVKSQELTKEFNGWQEDRQLAIIEEIMARGRIELVNELKTVITGDTLRVRRMRTDTYEVPNGINLLCFTNHENALPIEPGDRRWLTLFSPAEPRAPGYYRQLFDLLDGEAFAAAVKWMLQHRQAVLEPKGMAPMTGGKAEMRRRSTGDVEQYLDDLLEARARPFDFDLLRVDDVWRFVQSDFKGSRDLRGRVIERLRGAGAQQHNRYTKAGIKDRPKVVLWSLRDHEAWEAKGASARADAWQAFHGDVSI